VFILRSRSFTPLFPQDGHFLLSLSAASSELRIHVEQKEWAQGRETGAVKNSLQIEQRREESRAERRGEVKSDGSSASWRSIEGQSEVDVCG
jgi:hypothetical protein